MRPLDVASESEERCNIAYAFFTSDLIPIPDYSCRTKEQCRTTVAAHLRPREVAARRRKRCVFSTWPVSTRKGVTSHTHVLHDQVDLIRIPDFTLAGQKSTAGPRSWLRTNDNVGVFLHALLYFLDLV